MMILFHSMWLNVHDELHLHIWGTVSTHWGRADDIFKCNFVSENVLISIKISLNFVPEGPVDYKIHVKVHSYNDVVQHRCQVITWTNDYPLLSIRP